MTISGKSLLFGDFSKYLIRDVKDFTLLRLDERFAEFLQVAFLAFFDDYAAGGHVADRLPISASASWRNLPGGVGRVTTGAVDFSVDARAFGQLVSGQLRREVRFMGIPVVDGKTAYRAGLIFPKMRHYDPASTHNTYHDDPVMVTFDPPPAVPILEKQSDSFVDRPIALSSDADAGRDRQPTLAERDRGADATATA